MSKVWYIVIALVIILFLRECSNQRNTDKLIGDITAYSDSAKHYQIEVDGLKIDVATNSVLKLQSESQLKSLLGKNDSLKKLFSQFKKVQSAIIIKGDVQLVHDTIKFPVKIPCDFKPIPFVQKTKLYSFTGFVMPLELAFDTIRFYDDQSIVLGTKRKGLFKKEYTVDVIHSNPYFHTTNIGAYTVSPENKWYEKWWAHMLAGAVIGGVVDHKLLK